MRPPWCAVQAAYGREALALLAEHLRGRDAGDGTFAVLGYRLRDTLSDHGGVTRALCETDETGRLERIVELTGLVARDGAVVGRTLSGSEVALTGEETISRNCWGFTPALFEPLRRAFDAFVAQCSEADAELLLPVTMNALVASGEATVRVLTARSQAFGLTHPADLEVVRSAIRRLVAAGAYPPSLWS